MSEWQLIETAPRDGRWMLLFPRQLDNAPSLQIRGAWRPERGGNDHPWAEGNHTAWHMAVFSHWQPLPEPPKP